MKRILIMTAFFSGILMGCTENKQSKSEDNMQKLELTQEWDKVFPLSDKVNHRKVTFETQYGLTLAADLYWQHSLLAVRLVLARSSRVVYMPCGWQNVDS